MRGVSGESPAALLLGIASISNVKDLDNLGSFIAAASKALTPTTLSSFLNSRVSHAVTDLQLVAIGLILPLSAHPPRSFVFLSYALPRASHLPRRIRRCLLLRMARAAVLSDQAESLLATGELQRRCRDDPTAFELPLLYLAAHCATPHVVDRPVFAGDARTDAITLYWSGINKLLAREFLASDTDLLHAWQLSKAAKDIRPAVIEAMALAAFLAGKSPRVFASRVPRKWAAGVKWAARLWDEERIDFVGMPPLYRRLQTEVKIEHARRVVEGMALSVSRVRINDLMRISQIDSLEELVGIELQAEGDVIVSKLPNLTGRIQRELTELEHMAGKGGA
jgi:hypothetical protein